MISGSDLMRFGLSWKDDKQEACYRVAAGLFEQDTPQFGLLEGDTAIGKTFAAMLAAGELSIQRNKPVLIATFTRQLREVYRTEFEERIRPFFKAMSGVDLKLQFWRSKAECVSPHLRLPEVLHDLKTKPLSMMVDFDLQDDEIPMLIEELELLLQWSLDRLAEGQPPHLPDYTPLHDTTLLMKVAEEVCYRGYDEFPEELHVFNHVDYGAPGFVLCTLHMLAWHPHKHRSFRNRLAAVIFDEADRAESVGAAACNLKLHLDQFDAARKALRRLPASPEVKQLIERVRGMKANLTKLSKMLAVGQQKPLLYASWEDYDLGPTVAAFEEELEIFNETVDAVLDRLSPEDAAMNVLGLFAMKLGIIGRPPSLHESVRDADIVTFMRNDESVGHYIGMVAVTPGAIYRSLWPIVPFVRSGAQKGERIAGLKPGIPILFMSAAMTMTDRPHERTGPLAKTTPFQRYAWDNFKVSSDVIYPSSRRIVGNHFGRYSLVYPPVGVPVTFDTFNGWGGHTNEELIQIWVQMLTHAWTTPNGFRSEPGRVLATFASTLDREAVKDMAPAAVASHMIVLGEPDWFLKFERDPRAVLLSTRYEGVNLVSRTNGDEPQGLVDNLLLTRIPVPPLTPEMELLVNYIVTHGRFKGDRNRDIFNASPSDAIKRIQIRRNVVEGIRRYRQVFGRLIRVEGDAGRIYIGDPRAPYIGFSKTENFRSDKWDQAIPETYRRPEEIFFFRDGTVIKDESWTCASDKGDPSPSTLRQRSMHAG